MLTLPNLIKRNGFGQQRHWEAPAQINAKKTFWRNEELDSPVWEGIAFWWNFGGWQKGGFQKGGFGGCSPGTKTRTRVRSPKPPFYETALLSPSENLMWQHQQVQQDKHNIQLRVLPMNMAQSVDHWRILRCEVLQTRWSRSWEAGVTT